MTRDVLISVSGLQFEIEEDEALEVVSQGTYYFRNGKHYVTYEEFQEESTQPTSVLLKLSDQKMEMLKKGETNVHMLFEEGKQHTAMYRVPFGNLLMGINTTGLTVTETENEINAEVLYGLDINYAHVSDCQIKIKIMSREAALENL